MMRFGFVMLVAWSFCLIASSFMASGAIVEHSFHVQNLTKKLLCREQVITAVNGQLPGPTINVREGDTLVIHVFNESPHNITIHWHGVTQLLSAWADGPGMITQCPIRTGHSYTYRFNITEQEGTLWWHAHTAVLRATVYGAIVIKPRAGQFYPFPRPDKEVPIILGQWWDADVIAVEEEGLATGGASNQSDAYTINGMPGDLYRCAQNRMFKLKVVQGKTYLLRIVNAALNNQHFLKIANHKFIVVALDAAYTNPYVTDTIVIAPGQTVDALLIANQPIGSYYMVARPYADSQRIPFDNSTTRATVIYKGVPSRSRNPPLTPIMPPFNDTAAAHAFYSKITGLAGGPHWIPPPRHVDVRMFVTIGLGLEHCPNNTVCQGPNGQRLAASMNNNSLVLPTKLSMLEAFFNKVDGIYTADFPDNPPVVFDYTNKSNADNPNLIFVEKATRIKKVKYNAGVEIVFQDTALLTEDNHPMHIHGFNFHVMAQGFGNYNEKKERRKFNFVNPQIRNTIAVPTGGWAVVRFVANNPGVWFLHCHIEAHLPWGLATAFLVENGPTPSTRLPPPPLDLPKC